MSAGVLHHTDTGKKVISGEKLTQLFKILQFCFFLNNHRGVIVYVNNKHQLLGKPPPPTLKQLKGLSSELFFRKSSLWMPNISTPLKKLRSDCSKGPF